MSLRTRRYREADSKKREDSHFQRAQMIWATTSCLLIRAEERGDTADYSLEDLAPDDDGPAVDVDARASQLCLLAGIAGEPLAEPDVDPYAVAGFDRAVVKAYIAATIGAGRPPRVWTRKALTDAKEAGVPLPRSVRDVREAVLGRYPFLARLPELLGCEGEPRLCGHVLMGIESRSLTSAMLALTDKGILALPLHDALLVCESDAEKAREALARGYEAAGRVRVHVRVKRP